MVKQSDSNFTFFQRSELWLSVTFLVTLVVLIIPLPTFLLDMFLACSIAASIMLLLITLGAKRPLDVAAFPSLLLLLTLFRLSLNVATTRLILLDGNAGKIVSTFGDFVVGGNLIVGVVIFLILVIHSVHRDHQRSDSNRRSQREVYVGCVAGKADGD